MSMRKYSLDVVLQEYFSITIILYYNSDPFPSYKVDSKVDPFENF